MRPRQPVAQLVSGSPIGVLRETLSIKAFNLHQSRDVPGDSDRAEDAQNRKSQMLDWFRI